MIWLELVGAYAAGQFTVLLVLAGLSRRALRRLAPPSGGIPMKPR